MSLGYDENMWVFKWTFKSLRDLNWRWQKSQLKATFMCILSICFLIFVVFGVPYPHSKQFQVLMPFVSVWNIFSFTSASKPFQNTILSIFYVFQNVNVWLCFKSICCFREFLQFCGAPQIWQKYEQETCFASTWRKVFVFFLWL